MTFLATFLIICAAFAGLSIGVIIAGRRIKGSCGGEKVVLGSETLECGACPKKEADLCEESDESGLARLAQLGHPNKKNSH